MAKETSSWSRKLEPLGTRRVRVKETTVDSSAVWNRIFRPLRALWQSALRGPVGSEEHLAILVLTVLHPGAAAGKLQRSSLETLLGELCPAPWSKPAQAVAVSSPMVGHRAPARNLCTANSPLRGHHVLEVKVLSEWSVTEASSIGAAVLSSAWWRAFWTAFRVSS